MVKKKTIPLLYDHHTHTTGYAALLESVDLTEVKEKDEAVSLIKENCTEDKTNVVLGWNNSYYSFTEEELNEFPPVVICNLSFHGFIFNDKAEEKIKERFGNAKILERMNDPDWVERNLPAIMKFLVKLEGLDEKKLDSFFEYLSENGIWRTDDMLLPDENVLDLFEKTGYNERTDFWADLQIYDQLSEDAKKEVKGIKIFTDGALGPSTAALKEAYSDGTEGILVHRKEELKEIINGVEEDRVAVHALGDRAVEQVIESVEELEKKRFTYPNIRLEHAQFISKEYAEKAKELGIKLSMQPNFSHDSVHYSDRLSGKYAKKNNPFRILIDEVKFVPGDDLIFSSDGMPYGVVPSLEASLFPPYQSQRLTLDEFIAGFCLEDKEEGSIQIEIDEEEKKVSVEKVDT
ncbi:MAG: amidohydrolase family protein [Candidatus Thermoplasmatota archaeon]|nr:amidohydrolase family protein [Candidatus Thermoplasmatota archaeon]